MELTEVEKVMIVLFCNQNDGKETYLMYTTKGSLFDESRTVVSYPVPSETRSYDSKTVVACAGSSRLVGVGEDAMSWHC